MVPFEAVAVALERTSGAARERLRQYDLGRLVVHYDEAAIAAVINGFNRASIDACKRRSLAAAAELNWDVEKKRMLALYESVLQ